MIRILIADDHPLVRRGLVSLINATEDFELVGEAMHGLDAITMTERSRPDVVLMDLQMPRLNGVHATSAICRKLPTVKVLILTSFNEEDKVQQAMDAGAAGFMLKTATAEELVESIRSVVLGRMALSPEVVQAIVQSKRQPGTIGQDLTDRERDVLKLIVDGRSNADIGAALSITLPTVKFHVSSILSKLGFGDEKKEVVAEAAPAGVEVVAAPAPVAPVAISAVDVVAKLEGMAAAHAEKLNWKTSIVDLLKLLGLDSSLAVRKELAAELGCPADKMGDSAQMNMWLHKTVLQKLAANGGNIPAELL